jgi:hypothetical protein
MRGTQNQSPQRPILSEQSHLPNINHVPQASTKCADPYRPAVGPVGVKAALFPGKWASR